MPHYKDGTEAKVGDQVVGKLYNTAGIRAGTIISITPGADSCNAQVAFVEAVPLGAGHHTIKVPGMAVRDPLVGPGVPPPRARVVRAENHGSAGAEFALFECVDYCAVSELQLVGPT